MFGQPDWAGTATTGATPGLDRMRPLPPDASGDVGVDLAAAPGLDRASPLPLWAQLLDQLRSRLAAGEFAERFPTDGELVRDYAVSRQTARDAVRRLVDEGLLERQRGRPTRVRPVAFEQAPGALESLFESVEAQGLDQTSVTRLQDERTDDAAAAVLGLARDAPLVFIERLRLAGGEPLALDRSWMPARVARPLLDLDLTRTGIYVELAARCGVTLAAGSERVRPIVPRLPDRLLLKLPRGAAALAVERVVRDEGGAAVEWRRSLVRGDRWSLVFDIAPRARAVPWARADE